MMPSRRCIDFGHAWCDSIRARPASARRARSAVVGHQREDGLGVLGARLGDEQMLAGDGVDAAGGDVARDHRHAHRHRLEDLVLRAARDVERRDHQRGAPHVRPHVGHRARHRDAGQLAELPHRGRGVGADDQQLRRRALRSRMTASVDAQKSNMHSWFG